MNLDRPIPLRPDPGAIKANNQRSVARALAAFVISRARNESAERIVARAWLNDQQAALLTRAAVGPLTTAPAPALTLSVHGAFLLGLAPQSAATRLFAQALELNLTGKSTILIPRAAATTAPLFVAAGGAFPIGDGTLEFATVGPTRKLLVGAALTEETELYSSPESAAEVIGKVLADQASKRLDASYSMTWPRTPCALLGCSMVWRRLAPVPRRTSWRP